MRTAVACVFVLVSSVAAFDLELGPEGLNDAVTLGRSSDAARRTEFHRPYRQIVDKPPVDYIDIVTPFRRIVLAAEARLLAGERLFGQRDALDTLGDRPEQIDLRVELTFHPFNTFIGVPAYGVILRSVATGRAADVRSTELVSRFGPRVAGVPPASPTQGAGIARGPSQPLLGGTVIVTYDGRMLDRRGVYEATIVDTDGKPLATTRIDWSQLR